MTAYYNEFDKNAAAWLRELIKMGMIAPGDVDERSIIDVKPEDLTGYTQHHFFAGIGAWSYALRKSGWPDDTRVCTASLPCQPFSAAGKRKGKDDERHLLPHFLDLVKECDFPILFGEQVAPAIKQGWLDDLYDEMEREGYTCGSHVLTAAGAGSPHIRQRIYWAAIRMGDTQNTYGWPESQQPSGISGEAWDKPRGSSLHSSVAHSLDEGPQRRLLGGQDSQREDINGHIGRCGADNRLDDSPSLGQERNQRAGREARDRFEQSSSFSWVGNATSDRRQQRSANLGGDSERDRPQRQDGRIAEHGGIDWIYCRDGKYRPIKPGIKPLVNGPARGMGHGGDSSISPNETSEARVMRLKGYGNAIQIDTATAFIKAAMYAINEIN